MLEPLEPEYDDQTEQPTPEQLFTMEAVKCLTPSQKELWEYDRYDHLTQDEMAYKLGISQAAISQRLKTIERKLLKWMKQHKALYLTLKSALPKED